MSQPALDTDPWPFTDPRNVAVFTTQAVLARRAPMLHVSHDSDDGAWQFHSGETSTTNAPALASLEEVLRIDPSLRSLADLPLGVTATRQSSTAPWVRSLSR